MFMKKIIFLLFACFALTQSVSAQDYYESSSDIYSLGKTDFQKKWVRTFSISVAEQVEAGFNIRRNFGRYFAWDVYGISYGYDYFGCRDNIDVNHEIKPIRMGVRGFTPQLGRFKLYAAVGVAAEVLLYDRVYTEGGHYEYTYSPYGYSSTWIEGEEYRKSSESGAMCVDLQVGLYISNRVSIGYQANFHLLADKGRAEHNDHMFRLAIDF